MNLAKLYAGYRARLNSYRVRANELRENQSQLKDWEFSYKTEALISDLWQSWCHFSRELYLASCRGTTTRNGLKVTPLNNVPKDWKRLCYIARQTYQNNNINDTGHNNFYIRTEPTWGDLEAFIKIASGLSLHNRSQLVAAYGSFSNIKHLQLVRNACAHKNVETIRELNSYNYLYNFGRLVKATDFVWSTNNQSKTIAIDLWMYEMSKISDLATQ